MFTQLDRSLERTRGGLGIGLTLVRQLVERHGGTVRGFSEGPGHGSEFIVRLPVLIDRSRSTPGKAADDAATVTGRRILVVDDNKDSAESLATLLSMTGNETRTAHDGLAAVAAAEAFKPEVVLLDIGLPKLNGYDVARRIRTAPWGQSIVLLALTGWGQEDDRRRSREAGFNGHLVQAGGFSRAGQNAHRIADEAGLIPLRLTSTPRGPRCATALLSQQFAGVRAGLGGDLVASKHACELLDARRRIQA